MLGFSHCCCVGLPNHSTTADRCTQAMNVILWPRPRPAQQMVKAQCNCYLQCASQHIADSDCAAALCVMGPTGHGKAPSFVLPIHPSRLATECACIEVNDGTWLASRHCAAICPDCVWPFSVVRAGPRILRVAKRFFQGGVCVACGKRLCRDTGHTTCYVCRAYVTTKHWCGTQVCSVRHVCVRHGCVITVSMCLATCYFSLFTLLHLSHVHSVV